MPRPLRIVFPNGFTVDLPAEDWKVYCQHGVVNQGHGSQITVEVNVAWGDVSPDDVERIIQRAET